MGKKRPKKDGAALPIPSTTKALLLIKRAFRDDKRARPPRG